MSFKFMSAEEAASYINNGDVVGFSGFTPAGAAKAIPKAIAARAVEKHNDGQPFKIGVITGASTGDSLDGALARAEAVSFRTPYQSNNDMRALINAGKAEFFDMHLNQVASNIRYGFFGKINCAVIEACDVSENGEIVLTSSVGNSPTFCTVADKIFIELNKQHPKALRGMHDIYEPSDPPHRRAISVFSPNDRCGTETVRVNPAKIIGIVETDLPDEVGGFTPSDDITNRIGENVAGFLAQELKADRIPHSFLPIQSGVGNIANAVLAALGGNPHIPAFKMYTEVIQDAVVDLMKKNRVKFASSCALTVSPAALRDIYDNLDFFHPRLLLRPQEISNSPEVAKRLGIISINTALEADIFGNVNSTQVLGSKMMNGIGGSGDFTRNAYISIFTCPSVAKNGKISTIVPMASHIDHSEHSVQVIITEHGVADLRKKSPSQRSEAIINNCVHPSSRPILRDYYNLGGSAHTPQSLKAAFGMHTEFMKSGDMRLVDWAQYA